MVGPGPVVGVGRLLGWPYRAVENLGRHHCVHHHLIHCYALSDALQAAPAAPSTLRPTASSATRHQGTASITFLLHQQVWPKFLTFQLIPGLVLDSLSPSL